MRVASFVQDPFGKGGVAQVAYWYREWMGRHRQKEWQELILDDSDGVQRGESRSGNADPRLLKRPLSVLHIPPFIAGRRTIRRMRLQPSEAHVIGAVALQGYLAQDDWPKIVWMGTTIGDERRRTRPFQDVLRQVLHTVTLPGLEWIERSVLGSSERIMAHSPYTRDCILSLGIPPEKVDVVPVPIDTSIFRPSSDDRRGILFVGRAHDPRKRFDRVERLVSESTVVANEGVDVVSPGPPIGRRAGGIRWRGRVADLAQAYRLSKLLVMTSAQEGLGIVVFEALASGTPVVAFSCGGPDRFLEESGGGFVVGTFKEFQEKVELLLTDRDMYRGMATSGRSWVTTNMSSELFLSDPSIFRLPST